MSLNKLEMTQEPNLADRLTQTLTRTKARVRRFMRFDPYTLTDLPDDTPDIPLFKKLHTGTGARAGELLEKKESSVQLRRD